MQNVRYQLHDDKEDHRVYQLLQTQLLLIEKRQEEGRAVLPFLEAYLLSLACDDTGTIIGPQLVLPLLQKRLNAKEAAQYNTCLLVKLTQQDARQQELAALVASQQLLAEEEQEKKQAADKKAKKQKAKAIKQQQKQQQQQSDSEPESESASEYNLLKAPKAALFDVAPEPIGPGISDDDWSISKATALSAKRGWKAAPAISTVHNRRVPVVDTRLGHSSTSSDCVLAAFEPLKSKLQPQARPSVTTEGSSSSAAKSKEDKKMMDLFLCPITQVLGFGSPQMHSIAEAIACWSVACKSDGSVYL
ncbi:TPA: hypothetical protein ACH3X1_006429 [Trebouxia sp. C0004]